MRKASNSRTSPCAWSRVPLSCQFVQHSPPWFDKFQCRSGAQLNGCVTTSKAAKRTLPFGARSRLPQSDKIAERQIQVAVGTVQHHHLDSYLKACSRCHTACLSNATRCSCAVELAILNRATPQEKNVDFINPHKATPQTFGDCLKSPLNPPTL